MNKTKQNFTNQDKQNLRYHLHNLLGNQNHYEMYDNRYKIVILAEKALDELERLQIKQAEHNKRIDRAWKILAEYINRIRELEHFEDWIKSLNNISLEHGKKLAKWRCNQIQEKLGENNNE